MFHLELRSGFNSVLDATIPLIPFTPRKGKSSRDKYASPKIEGLGLTLGKLLQSGSCCNQAIAQVCAFYSPQPGILGAIGIYRQLFLRAVKPG
jgi:hypothetical protein